MTADDFFRPASPRNFPGFTRLKAGQKGATTPSLLDPMLAMPNLPTLAAAPAAAGPHHHHHHHHHVGHHGKQASSTNITSAAENALNSRFSDMYKAFKFLDLDCNGKLNRKEIGRALQLWNVASDEASADALFKACDTDNSGEIDYKEFVKVLARARFSRLDKPETRERGERWRGWGGRACVSSVFQTTKNQKTKKSRS